MNFFFPINKLHNRFAPQGFRWKYGRTISESSHKCVFSFTHEFMEVWNVCHWVFATDMRNKSQVWVFCKGSGTLFILWVSVVSQQSAQGQSSVRYCRMLDVPGSEQKIYWVPQENSAVVSGEFCLWTWILTDIELWAAEKAVLFLHKVVGLTAGRWGRVDWKEENGCIYSWSDTFCFCCFLYFTAYINYDWGFI